MLNKHEYVINKWNTIPHCFKCGDPIHLDNTKVTSIRGYRFDGKWSQTIWFCSAKCCAEHVAYLLDDLKEVKDA